MQEIAVITVISDDKPGVVEAIAQAFNECGGNWLESKLAQMSGKFAGVIQVSINRGESEKLQQSLRKLEKRGIHTTYEALDARNIDKASGDTNNTTYRSASFHAIGPDRQGIVKELSSAFLAKNINVKTLETKLSSMPYSGEPLFEASGTVHIPDDVTNPKDDTKKDETFHDLHRSLDDIANDLGIDISLSLNDELS